MPEAQWYIPVNQNTAEVHESLGITSWYTDRADAFDDSYDGWALQELAIPH